MRCSHASRTAGASAVAGGTSSDGSSSRAAALPRSWGCERLGTDCDVGFCRLSAAMSDWLAAFGGAGGGGTGVFPAIVPDAWGAGAGRAVGAAAFAAAGTASCDDGASCTMGGSAGAGGAGTDSGSSDWRLGARACDVSASRFCTVDGVFSAWLSTDNSIGTCVDVTRARMAGSTLLVAACPACGRGCMRHATPSAKTSEAATPSAIGHRRRGRPCLDEGFGKIAIDTLEVDDAATPASRAAARMCASSAVDGSPRGAICASRCASSRSRGVNDVGSFAFIRSW